MPTPVHKLYLLTVNEIINTLIVKVRGITCGIKHEIMVSVFKIFKLLTYLL